ncbi:DUF1826 domain-containing protein [uncultured Roseobacter sp.]|uniref:DUF1826 domain-containing protein n=1 Tax=uncultured Roseobacter sp. TaxID=114847 RepID=UPI002615DC4D|nr:DUF1826 domain-containing protein [uncultured Roseobacter sp.]
MNFIRKTARDAAIGVGVADDPASLDVFLRPGCAAAIWRRQTPPDVQSWIEDLDPDVLPRGRTVLRPSAVPETFDSLCEMSGLPEGPARDWLREDIATLASVVSELLKASVLRFRLDVVTTNACRKFHIDAITARLVCTYRGTGTQYGISPHGRDPNRVFTVPTGAPILLRGTLWPTEPPSGLLHRSPPIEGTDETRLVLVLDPVFDPDDDA